MAFLKINNIKISGLSACVPKRIEENRDFPMFNEESYRNFVATTGIERRRIVASDVTTSDLCVAAAERMIQDLKWNKEDILFCVFVTQTPDYILPATSPIIQERLGLSQDCYTLDISLGCSGWVYGLSVISALMSNLSDSDTKIKGILMSGDTSTKGISSTDKSTYPLFGDAGTATALEVCKDAPALLFNMNSDGTGYQTIIINDGGYRNPVTEKSFEKQTRGEGIESSNLNLFLDGMDVFAFGIKRAPESVNRLIEHFSLDKNNVDYFTFHQANKFMNEQIRKKLKIEKEKVPYSLQNFGNTSSATIPLTMITELSQSLSSQKLSHIGCGFGVGLSWGTVWFETDKIVCSELIEI